MGWNPFGISNEERGFLTPIIFFLFVFVTVLGGNFSQKYVLCLAYLVVKVRLKTTLELAHSKKYAP